MLVKESSHWCRYIQDTDTTVWQRTLRPNEKIDGDFGHSSHIWKIYRYLSFHNSIVFFAGFAGTIKHRYADFQVNEIDLEGNVVRLTSYEPPVYPSQMAKPEIDESKVNGLIFVDDIAKIKSLVDLKDSIESVEIEVTNFSKEQRTFLHKYVQLVSNNKLNSNTVDRNGKKYIEVNNKKKLRQEIQRSNSQRIKFLHFTAMKTNTDTSEMLFLLGKQLSKKISKFTIAGKFQSFGLFLSP